MGWGGQFSLYLLFFHCFFNFCAFDIPAAGPLRTPPTWPKSSESREKNGLRFFDFPLGVLRFFEFEFFFYPAGHTFMCGDCVLHGKNYRKSELTTEMDSAMWRLGGQEGGGKLRKPV